MPIADTEDQAVRNYTVHSYPLGFSGRCTTEELLNTLKEQQTETQDVCATVKSLAVESTPHGFVLVDRNGGGGVLRSLGTEEAGPIIRYSAVPQFCNMPTVPIPVRYARSMIEEHPSIFANYLSDIFAKQSKKVYIRTMRGQVRAVMSGKYRRLDNLEVASKVLMAFRDTDAHILDCMCYESRMRIRAVNYNVIEKIQTEYNGGAHEFVKFGAGGNKVVAGLAQYNNHKDDTPDEVDPGTIYPIVSITNGEAGDGGTSLSAGFLEAWCVNGALQSKPVLNLRHIGSDMEEGVYKPETLRMEDDLLITKLRDATIYCLGTENLKTIADRIRDTDQIEIKEPVLVTKVVGTGIGLSENECNELLKYFIRDYKPTAGGLGRAMTRFAQDTNDLDKVHTLETTGYGIMTGHINLSDEIASATNEAAMVAAGV